jgi:hypothetical protein
VPITPEYVAAIKYIKEHQYHRALSKLQKLVTQRLFELQRLNISHTGERTETETSHSIHIYIGYKMRTHITKSLQTRSKTIQQALASYNAATAALSPPRLPLS